jgi:hypothetical protein
MLRLPKEPPVTAQTRRRIWIAVIALALALPAESVLLQAGSTLDQVQAADDWAASLSAADLTAAASQIESYSFVYRRAIMKAAWPSLRSAVWQHHIEAYMDAHPDLPSDAVPVLKAVTAAATPEVLSDPTDAERAEIDSLAEQVQAVLGQDVADYLLYRLGPPDTAVTTAALPVSQRLADWLRGHFVALASSLDCNCSLDWGCSAFGTYCANDSGCTPDTTWPMCGWLWDETCDGFCDAGMGA